MPTIAEASTPLWRQGYAAFVKLWDLTPDTPADKVCMLVDALDEVLLRRVGQHSWFQNPYGGSALFFDVDTCLESVLDVIASLSATGAVISIGIAWGNFERTFVVRDWNTVAIPVNTAARLASIPEIRGCVAVHPKVREDMGRARDSYTSLIEQEQSATVKDTEFRYHLLKSPYRQIDVIETRPKPSEGPGSISLKQANIVSFDIEKFSLETETRQRELLETLFRHVEQSLNRVGKKADDVWTPAGDGGQVIFPAVPENSSPQALQFAQCLLGLPPQSGLRLRVGIDSGPIVTSRHRAAVGGALLRADEISAYGNPTAIAVSTGFWDGLPDALKADVKTESSTTDSVLLLMTRSTAQPVPAGALRETASNRQDSTVFLSLPNLKSQARESFNSVPLGFDEEVQRAEKDRDARKLTLLGLETGGFPWESTGLLKVGRAQLLIKRYGAAKTAWESLRKLDGYDLEANTTLGDIYQRLDDLTSSNQALDRAQHAATSPADLAEIHGRLGRNKKDLWTRSWSTAASSDEKARNAIDSPLLMEAYAQYLDAYRLDLNSYYPGLNALFLAVIIVELATRYPEVWSAPFADATSADVKLAEIKRQRDQIAKALQLRFDSAEAPVPEGVKQDMWLLSSAGDLNLLTLPPNPRRASYFYKKAAAAGGDFVLDSARRQLVMLTRIGVLNAQIEEVLKAFPPESAPATDQRIDRVLLFTGHRIDSANRAKPRFPANKESVAREAIRTAVAQEKDLISGSILGIAGGANGGDILFLEACDELGIKTEMLLPLPENQFIESSVENEDKSWLRRFHAQLEKHPNTPVLADSPELPKWLQFKRGYDIWQRNNLWLLSEALCLAPKNLTVIGLWDGEAGDGPGGTEHMVTLAKDRGARFVRLDTKKLFDLT